METRKSASAVTFAVGAPASHSVVHSPWPQPWRRRPGLVRQLSEQGLGNGTRYETIAGKKMPMTAAMASESSHPMAHTVIAREVLR